MNAERLRVASANLYAIAQTFEVNQIITATRTGPESDVWNEAVLRMMDVIEGMDAAADEIEGMQHMPRLRPLPARAAP